MCCKLLTSIGPKLDGFEERVEGKGTRKRIKKKSSFVTPELIESYYTELLRIKQLKVLPARVNFQILDLIDLRKSRWKHRREQVVAKTKMKLNGILNGRKGRKTQTTAVLTAAVVGEQNG